mmetsp:Transcript_27398/g.74914  ORF Transcript_27398/g.74914 Transcript_27398/m.74914 type:complete len:268 (+) Transcript_27398:1102-1905(+)
MVEIVLPSRHSAVLGHRGRGGGWGSGSGVVDRKEPPVPFGRQSGRPHLVPNQDDLSLIVTDQGRGIMVLVKVKALDVLVLVVDGRRVGDTAGGADASRLFLLRCRQRRLWGVVHAHANVHVQVHTGREVHDHVHHGRGRNARMIRLRLRLRLRLRVVLEHSGTHGAVHDSFVGRNHRQIAVWIVAGSIGIGTLRKGSTRYVHRRSGKNFGRNPGRQQHHGTIVVVPAFVMVALVVVVVVVVIVVPNNVAGWISRQTNVAPGAGGHNV